MGESQSQKIAWPRKAIESVKNVLKKGLQFFDGHNPDNSTTGRKSVAEYVGRIAKEIGGRLHEIVVGYFPDKEIAKNYDICSIEADIATTEIPGAMIIATAIEKLTGIALGNSADETPAFAGAKKLLSVQCFENTKKIQGTEKTLGGNPMTFEELKIEIKKMNVHPSQVYSLEEIKSDRTFASVFDERDSLKTENDNLKKSADESSKKVADQEKQILRNDAKSRLNTFIPKGATDKQKEFIAKRVEKKFDKIDDLTDEGLKQFVDDNLDDYNDFGGDSESNNNNDNQNQNNNGDDNQNQNQNSEELSNVDEAIKDAMS